MAAPLIGCTTNYIPPEQPGCPSRVGCSYLNRTYIEAILSAGGVPVALVHQMSAGDVDALLDRLDGLFLTGGKDVDSALWNEPLHPSVERIIPEKTAFEAVLVRRAVERRVPVLGACLGIQMINVALGGDMYQDLPSQYPGALSHRQTEAERHAPCHDVEITPGSLLHRVVGATRLPVNSVHHQAVRRVADGLQVTARSEDGVIEGLEGSGSAFLLGVQWHPEDLLDQAPHRALFEALVVASSDLKDL